MTKDISFAICTYNRPEDTLELLKNLLSLDEFDTYVEDIVIVNNGSTVSYLTVESYIDHQADLRIKYQRLPENLGAAAGKNVAFDLSNGHYIIMPDDDCLMADSDCLQTIVHEFETLHTDREVAILVFKLLYHSTHQIQWSGFPHKNFKKYGSIATFQTYFFPGGACAFKRSAIKKTGLYNTDIFFAQEEYDLALKLIGAGYCFVYTDKVSVLHKESPLERYPPPKRSMLNWVNKSRITYTYLPKKYFWSTAFFWAMQHLRESKGNLKYFLPAIHQIVQIPFDTKRTPISLDALNYLKKVEARLWY